MKEQPEPRLQIPLIKPNQRFPGSRLYAEGVIDQSPG